MKTLDFRSDTVTRPTPAMRAAMAQAEVGDDVFGDDPTVNRLQEQLAQRLGKEAALFVPSGTMSNQIGVRLHCAPGDEVVLDVNCHIYCYEQGGVSQLSGIATRTIDGDGGLIRQEQLAAVIRPDDDHQVRTRLFALENTHNRGGGKVLPYEEVVRVCRWAHEHGLATHLDGARLFNAEVATGIPAAQWASHFDTVSVCFSKGLGAPVGSALAGSHEQIRRARRIRKLFGGGMRQAGILAAGAMYALEHHVERLAQDHAHAQLLAEAIRSQPGLQLCPDEVDTNIVIFEVADVLGGPANFCRRLADAGVWLTPIGRGRLRAVTHLDVSRADVERACDVLRAVARAPATPVTAKSSPGGPYN